MLQSEIVVPTPVVFSEIQVKALRGRIEEAESMGVRKMKAQLQAMESRVGSLEEQLDTATRSVGSSGGNFQS